MYTHGVRGGGDRACLLREKQILCPFSLFLVLAKQGELIK